MILITSLKPYYLLNMLRDPLNLLLYLLLFKILLSLLPCSLGRHKSYKSALPSGGSLKVRPRWLYYVHVRRIGAPKEPLNIQEVYKKVIIERDIQQSLIFLN